MSVDPNGMARHYGVRCSDCNKAVVCLFASYDERDCFWFAPKVTPVAGRWD